MTKKTALSPRHYVKRRGDFPIFSIGDSVGVEDTAESTDVIFDVVKFSPESEKLPKTEKQTSDTKMSMTPRSFWHMRTSPQNRNHFC